MTSRAFAVTAWREDGSVGAASVEDSLAIAKAEARLLMDADLGGDCYVAVEVAEVLDERRIRCFYETRRGSALELRRLLLAKRRG